jgi:hypothetical protein
MSILEGSGPAAGRWRWIAAAPSLAACAAMLAACGGGGNEAKTVDDAERGVRYVVPPGWTPFDGEARSSHGSLFSVRVYELQGADSGFLAGLPDSVVPQLEDWARQYFVVDGPVVRGETTVGGLPAAVLTYPVRVRAADPISKLRYWVVRKDERLFVLRFALPPDAPPDDEASFQELLSSFSFL